MYVHTYLHTIYVVQDVGLVKFYQNRSIHVFGRENFGKVMLGEFLNWQKNFGLKDTIYKLKLGWLKFGEARTIC